MSEFTAAQFRSLIDAMELIENVVKAKQAEITEDEYPAEDRDSDERLRAYRQDQSKKIAVKKMKTDQKAKADKNVADWRKNA
jgi:hypothetical protein